MSSNQPFAKALLTSEKNYFIRYFLYSTVGLISVLTMIIIAFIALSRLWAFHSASDQLVLENERTQKLLIKERVEQVKEFAQYRIRATEDEAKAVLKNTVQNVKKAMLSSYAKAKEHQSRDTFLQRYMNSLRAIKDLNIADIDRDNRFFIIDDDARLLLEPNNPSLEGKVIKQRDGVEELLSAARKSDEGSYFKGYPFVDGEDAWVYAVHIAPLGITIGSHVDRHDIMAAAKVSTIEGIEKVFFNHDRELIVADTASMMIKIHANQDAVNKVISDYPELVDSFGNVVNNLKSGEHYSTISCIKDFKKSLADLKVVYVDMIAPLELIVSTGFFESDYRAVLEKQVAELKSKMFKEMLQLVVVIALFSLLILIIGLHYRKKLSASFDYFGQKIDEAQKKLARSYIVDPLTKLHNRNALNDILRQRNDIALAIVNIDNFSQINDSYGSDVGDKVIIHLSQLLIDHFSESSYRVYRLHADEFAVLMLGTDDLEAHLRPRLRALIQKLRIQVESIDTLPISIHLSAGLSQGGEKTLLHANMALKMAREQRVGCMSFEQSGDSSQNYKENIEVTNLIKWAIENDTLVPFFQPIYDIKNGSIDKFECLIRLFDPDGTMVAPGHFLPAASKSSLSHFITKIVLRKSIEHFKGSSYSFSVNIMLSDILNQETSQAMLGMIEKNGIGSQVIFEITESEELEFSDEVAGFFNAAKALGCRIAIDDFGTGYSNFNYLKKLKPDFLKLDGSLIQGLGKDSEQERLLELIVGYASVGGIKTVAEFISDKKLLKRVKKLGIDFAQGSYISEPSATTDALVNIDVQSIKGVQPRLWPTGL